MFTRRTRKRPASPLPSNATSPQASAAAGDGETLQLAEPDFRVVNLPTTLRLPRHRSSFQLTHRFNGNLSRGSSDEQASNLFGLDQGAVVGFEYRFIARRLQAVVYRTGADKTFQFYGKYDPVRQGASMPVSVSGVVRSRVPTTSRSASHPPLVRWFREPSAIDWQCTRRPPGSITPPAIFDADRDTFFVGLGGRLRVSSTVYVVGEVSPRVAGYKPDSESGATAWRNRHRTGRKVF